MFIRINQKVHSSKSLVAQMVKNPPVKWETWVRSLGQRSLVSYSPWGCKDLATKQSTLFKNSADSEADGQKVHWEIQLAKPCRITKSNIQGIWPRISILTGIPAQSQAPWSRSSSCAREYPYVMLLPRLMVLEEYFGMCSSINLNCWW